MTNAPPPDVTQMPGASFGRRLLAFVLIDCLLVFLTLVMVGRFSAIAVSTRVDPPTAVWLYRGEKPLAAAPDSSCRPNLLRPACAYYEGGQNLADAREHKTAIFLGFFAISLTLWLLYLAAGNATGLSLGKALFGLRVVSVRPRKRAWLQGPLRTIGYVVSALPVGLGFFAVLWNPQRRAWHDRIAGTACIRQDRQAGVSRAPALATAISLLALLVAGPAAGAQLFIPTPSESTQLTQDADRPAVVDDVLVGFRAIDERYVDTVDAPALLTSAWNGALVRAQQASVELPPQRAGTIQTEKELRFQLQELVFAAKGKLSESELVLAAIDVMADSLGDDHTYFVTPERAQLIARGQSSTLGAQVITSRDPAGLLVWDVDPGTVADRIGIRPGDVLTMIDGAPARSVMTEPGKQMSITLLRRGAGTLTLQATGEVRPDVRLDSRMLEDGIGYIRLSGFSTSSDTGFADRLETELHSLIAQGAQSWVLDLRNNAGGLARNAAVVSGRLGFDGPLLKNHLRGGRIEELKPLGPAVFKGAPGVILMNERSASSSEIVAGAMQDAGAAYVIGNKSSGRVNLSRSIPVGGGLLYVTIARTGIGSPERSLSGIGVHPNEVVAHSVEALSTGHDLQLERAVAHLRSAMKVGATASP